MKKCIASFLICFVFAFGVITAFGCRDEVYAGEQWKIDASVPSDALFRAYMNDICELDGFENAYSTFWDFISSYDGSSFLSLYRFSYSCVLPAESSLAGQIYKEVWYSAIISSSSDFDTVCNSNTYCVLKSVSYYDGSILSQSSCSTATRYSSLNTIYNSYLDYSSRDGYTSTFGELWNSVDFNTSADFVFGSNYEYSDEIGYLTGFSHQATQYIESESSNSDQGKFWDTYSWNLTTSTGYSIQSDDTVRLRLVCSYGDFARDIVEYDVSGDKSVYMVDRSDLLEQCDSIAAYKDSLSFWEILTSGFGKSDPLSVVCYACVFTSDGRCGSWIRQDSTWNMDNGGNGYDPNVSVGNFDDDGNFVSDSDKGYVGGQGNSTYDPDTGILYSGVDNLDSSSLIGAIKNLVDGVGQVPQIIALMFLWLPSWVLTFFSVCVAIWGLVLVKKAIFG